MVANAGHRSQIASTRKRLRQAETVAIGCDRSPRAAHGKDGVCHRLPPVAEVPLSVKEGVDGSSPSEGFDFSPA
jgi:hypothetical protein